MACVWSVCGSAPRRNLHLGPSGQYCWVLVTHAASHVPFLILIVLKQTHVQGHRGWTVGVVVFLGKNKVVANEIIAEF